HCEERQRRGNPFHGRCRRPAEKPWIASLALAMTAETERISPLARRELLCRLERRASDAARDVGVEGWPRRHHLEQPHQKIQRRADRDIGGGKVLAEDPRSLLQGGVEHVENALS